MSQKTHIPISVLISGKNAVNSWAREMNLIMAQPEILAGEDYKGNAKFTRDLNVLTVFDEEAVEEIVNGAVHPEYESGKHALAAYDREFTYDFVFTNWEGSETSKFIYNYFDRFINYPLPRNFVYQGNPYLAEVPEAYVRPGTNGFDQIKWLHDAIRRDGISRRHEIITWIPGIDDFSANPPCLQRIWIRVLVPKSEWKNYPGCIPVEVHIDYRSWDIARAQPSNLYGLTRMLYRYVLGNLTPDTEYIRDAEGKPIRINEEGNNIEFKIVKLVCFGDAAHVYEDSYGMAKRVKPVMGSIFGV